ncbi:hypothetical protein HW452_05145 [Halomonas aquamarina]|uniref:Uncharacterized protein n=1 Tax=Vreelandella aquamarina TaxID=77097 RepID=A0ACC5VRY2_9GAMM|nr:hypothetical protein [Halomonas aquamarina]MBZ5486907.1 hypothetical protein [Halomonas aquamarina]
MKLRVTKPNLYHRGNRKAVGDIITIEGDKIPTVFAGKVEPINESGLTTDKDAGGELTALRDENDDLKQDNEALRAENAKLKAEIHGAANGTTGDSSDEADANRKAWLIDEIEKLTGERPGFNSKLETLETKFEKAKLADEE